MSRALQRGRGPSSRASRLALLIALALPGQAIPTEVRSGDRLATALTGGRVMASPCQVIERGVVVIRGGVIEAVGPEGKIAIPPDARVLDLHGQWIYPAFIEPFLPADRLAGKKRPGPLDDDEPPPREEPPPRPGPNAHPLSTVRAEHRIVDSLLLKERVVDSYRRLGFAVVNAFPQLGILRGKGTIVTLGDGPIGGRIVNEEFGQHISLEPARTEFGRSTDPPRAEPPRRVTPVYPVSKKGAVALVRQAFRDALWWHDAQASYASHPAQARPKLVSSNVALVPAAQGKETVIFEATDVLSLLRAAKIAQEFKLKALYV